MSAERNISGTNVAIIGGAGFLGSHLVDYLIEEKGCQVLVIDNLESGRREFIHPKATFEHHDITGSESYLLNLFKHHSIQFVMNYAACPYIPVSFARPLHVFNVNAFGALKVINAAHEAGCEGILQVSSAEIYGEGGRAHTEGWEPTHEELHSLTENAEVIPHSSYGASKAVIDSLVQVRWMEAKVPCIALRQFNCIGPRETHRYVVPEIISQIHNWCYPPLFAADPPGKVPQVYLGNNSFRDFQYAGDAVKMAVELLEKGNFGSVYNMGSQTGVKIYNLAKMIGEIMGFPEIEIIQDPARIRPWEIWHLQSCNDKLYSIIEARPTVSLQEALQRTVADFYSSGNKWSWQ